jgi:hypothetical protein
MEHNISKNLKSILATLIMTDFKDMESLFNKIEHTKETLNQISLTAKEF